MTLNAEAASNESTVQAFDYMMLNRLQMDLEYYFGNGNKVDKHLFYDTIEEHITEVRKQWDALPADGKPEWFTEQELADYEAEIQIVSLSIIES